MLIPIRKAARHIAKLLNPLPGIGFSSAAGLLSFTLDASAIMSKSRSLFQNFTVAMVYDFDGTLARGDCAEHGLMPAIGVDDAKQFWDEVKARAKDSDADEILTYMGYLVLSAKRANAWSELSWESMELHGRTIPLFPGVEEWFDKINRYAIALNIRLEHYVVTSGLEAMIAGTDIAKHFVRIFGCRYHYDEETGHPKWPAVAINYTTKTQYLFRINKGCHNSYDNDTVNKYIEPSERPIPFERMIYFGDGLTDIPAMKLVREQGGCSIGVFDSDKWQEERTQEKVEQLISEDRVSYVVPGDYSMGEMLSVAVKGRLRKIARTLDADHGSSI